MLEIRDLWADYGGAPVLRGVSLDVAAGEVVGLVGPNGSGKTTLVRAVTRVMPLRSGEVRLLGEDCRGLTRAALARRVAVVPQNPALPEGFTVWRWSSWVAPLTCGCYNPRGRRTWRRRAGPWSRRAPMRSPPASPTSSRAASDSRW